MIPMTILLEPLTECMLLGLLSAWSVFYLFRWDPISFFLIHILVWFLMDWILIHIVQNGALPCNKFEFLVSKIDSTYVTHFYFAYLDFLVLLHRKDSKFSSHCGLQVIFNFKGNFIKYKILYNLYYTHS